MDPTLLLMHAAALELLTPFVQRAGTDEERYLRLLSLRPLEADFDLVFRPSLVEGARALYVPLWSNPPPPLVPKPGQNWLWVRTAWTEDFVNWTRQGQEFPGGYKKLAQHLQPGLEWVAWKFVEQGETTGLSFDGLVRVGERFVWFPQPWRLVPMGGTVPPRSAGL